MHSYIKRGLILSLVAISSLYGVDITIDKDTPYKTYKKYLKGDWFIFGRDNNNITWNNKPESHKPVWFKIRGGYSDTESVIGNKLIFNNYLDKGRITHIIAGESAEANSADNTLIMQGKQQRVASAVYAGFGKLEVKNNTLIINSGDFFSIGCDLNNKDKDNCLKVYAGYSKNGLSSDNNLVVNGGFFSNSVILSSGYSEDGDVKNNTTIFNGNNKSNVYIYGGYSKNGSAIGNKATFIRVGSDDRRLNIKGGYGKLDALNNSLIIEDGRIQQFITTKYAGVVAGHALTGNAVGNSLTIDGGDIDYSRIFAGLADKGNANDNTFIIDGVRFIGSGFSLTEMYAGKAEEGKAIGNKLIIKRADIIQDERIEFAGGYGGKAANENTLTVEGPISGENIKL